MIQNIVKKQTFFIFEDFRKCIEVNVRVLATSSYPAIDPLRESESTKPFL